MRNKMIALFAAGCSSMAMAAERPWTVSEASGPVQVSRRGIMTVATRGTTIAVGDTVATGRTGRAVLVRGGEYMMVAPNSRVHLPEAEEASGMTRVVEEFGNIVFIIKKKLTPHFEVRTPYLAAVVKGTTFSVGVSDRGSSVQVLEGAVDVATPDGGAHDLLRPGSIARVGVGDLGRMEVEAGGIKRLITSPAAAPATDAPASGVAVVPVQEGSAVASPVIADATVFEEPVALATVTGGLVTGTVGGGDLAELAFASRVASEASVTAVKTVEAAAVTLAVVQQSETTANEALRQDTAVVAAASAKAEADRVATVAADEAARSTAAAAQAAADQTRSDAARALAAAAAEQASRDAAAAASAKAAADAALAAMVAEQAAAAAAQAQSEKAARDAAEVARAASAKDMADAQAAAVKAAGEAQALAQKAAAAAAATQQAQADNAARAIAQAALDAAAQKAVQEAQRAAAEAQKAKADQAARAVEEVASKARDEAAKAAAELAKQQEKAAKEAQKAAADAAKAAEDAARDKQKEPNGVANGILDAIKALVDITKNGKSGNGK